MGDTIHLDPYDCFLLSQNLGIPFSGLLDQQIALHVEEGMILPHLKMQEESGNCSFLDQDGRCSIHSFRPGLCRLFPLWRNYQDGTMQYFIVEDGCTMEDKTKVKISKWLDIPQLSQYETFAVSWHYFVKERKQQFMESGDDSYNKKMNLFLLQTFYLDGFDAGRDFYEQFGERLERVKKVFH
jgi:Fe-S-cluster containining protein